MDLNSRLVLHECSNAETFTFTDAHLALRSKRRAPGDTIVVETVVILDAAYIAKLRESGVKDEDFEAIVKMKWDGVSSCVLIGSMF